MTLKSLIPTTALLVACFAACEARAATATYSFSGTSGDTTSFSYNGTTFTGITFSALTKNGVTSSSSTGNFRASAWTTGATDGSSTFTGGIDTTDYFQFTITPSAGYVLDLTSISFGIGRSSTGPRQFQWRASTNSFGSAITTYSATNASVTVSSGVFTVPDLNSSWTGNVMDLSGASYQDLTGPITFRFYAYNAEAAAGTGGFQGNLSIDFTAIPEPQHYAIAFAVLAFAAIVIRRRQHSPES